MIALSSLSVLLAIALAGDKYFAGQLEFAAWHLAFLSGLKQIFSSGIPDLYEVACKMSTELHQTLALLEWHSLEVYAIANSLWIQLSGMEPLIS